MNTYGDRLPFYKVKQKGVPNFFTNWNKFYDGSVFSSQQFGNIQAIVGHEDEKNEQHS